MKLDTFVSEYIKYLYLITLIRNQHLDRYTVYTTQLKTVGLCTHLFTPRGNG